MKKCICVADEGLKKCAGEARAKVRLMLVGAEEDVGGFVKA